MFNKHTPGADPRRLTSSTTKTKEGAPSIESQTFDLVILEEDACALRPARILVSGVPGDWLVRATRRLESGAVLCVDMPYGFNDRRFQRVEDAVIVAQFWCKRSGTEFGGVSRPAA